MTKVIAITGASAGTGCATGLRLARDGSAEDVAEAIERLPQP